ncbi:Aspartate aminotransferase, cytoplasmic [Savitreella phatthalungensis]
MVNSQAGVFADVPALPGDPIFALNTMFSADKNPEKINLGAGAYRDEDGRPWVLPSVQSAKLQLINDPTDEHEYPPIEGRPAFRALAAKLIFGADSRAITEARIASNQTISGTGANHLAGLFLRRMKPEAQLYVSSPTWGNHHAIYERVGYKHLHSYPYWDPASRSLDIQGMLATMQSAPEGSIFLLHACAHNPTGVDPTREQWSRILATMQSRRHIALFDSAYQGFASGSLDADAYAVRLFVEAGEEVLVAQSFSKNLGIYGERAGCLHVVCRESDSASRVATQLADLTRGEISCTPLFGAKIAELVISSPELYAQWRDHDLPTMAGRIIRMRQLLHARLVDLATPGDWSHIVSQIGMFSYTGLTPAQCDVLVKQKSVYLANNGRISMCGLNERNIDYFARCIDEVVRSSVP